MGVAESCEICRAREVVDNRMCLACNSRHNAIRGSTVSIKTNPVVERRVALAEITAAEKIMVAAVAAREAAIERYIAADTAAARDV